MHAARHGLQKAVEALIQAGADVNASIDEGHSVVMYVAEKGHEGDL